VPSMLQQIGCAEFEEKTRGELYLFGGFKWIEGLEHWRSVEERGNKVVVQKYLKGVYVHFQMLSSEFDWQTLPTRSVRLEIATGSSRQYGSV
jgi:hypothetical protein